MFIFKKQKKSVFELLGHFGIKSLGSLHISRQNRKDKDKQIIKPTYIAQNFGYQEKIKKIEENSNLTARNFGIATHYLLEMMKDFTLESLDQSILLTQNKFINVLDNKNFDNIYNRVKLLINDSTFKDIVSNSDFTKEQSLIYNGELKTLDLLIKKDDRWIIVDYKTTNEKSLSHIKQIQYYKEAIKNIIKSDKIDCYLVYLYKDNIQIDEVK